MLFPNALCGTLANMSTVYRTIATTPTRTYKLHFKITRWLKLQLQVHTATALRYPVGWYFVPPCVTYNVLGVCRQWRLWQHRERVREMACIEPKCGDSMCEIIVVHLQYGIEIWTCNTCTYIKSLLCRINFEWVAAAMATKSTRMPSARPSAGRHTHTHKQQPKWITFSLYYIRANYSFTLFSVFVQHQAAVSGMRVRETATNAHKTTAKRKWQFYVI